jgi:hypothetical protein
MAGMLALRYLYVLALVVWLGGIVMAGAVVAPSVFGVLELRDPELGRVAAGQVFGAVLGKLHLIGYVAGFAMLVILTVLRLLGPRPVSYGIRAGIIVAMLALTVYSGRFISPRVEALQAAVSGPMNRLEAADPRRVEFDGLHQRSTWLMSLVAAGGLLLAGWEARE